MQTISITTKLKMTNEDKQSLIKALKAQRDCFNYCSREHFGSKINSLVLIHRKCYEKYRKLNPHVKAQFVIRAENDVLACYRSIKTNKHKIDKPVIKRSLSCNFDQRLYSLKNGVFRLTTLGKRIEATLILYPKLKTFLKKYKFGDIKIAERDDEIYITLPFKVDDKPVKTNLSLGVDLGIRRVAATSEGNIYIDKQFNARKRKLRYLKRQLNSKKLQSKTANKHLNKVRFKEHNANKNFIHNLTNKILQTKANTIVLEKLDVKKMKSKKNRYQNKNRISQTSFTVIKQYLTYKAALLGKEVVCVSPYYTSQTDHLTGDKGNRLGCRFYGKNNVYDSDVNAAINIAKRYTLPVSQGNPLDGQAIVNSPIVA